MKTIPLFKVFMSPKVDHLVSNVLHSGYIGQGVKVEAFEDELKEFLKNPHALTVNSGTSALHLAMHMANIEGKYVITTPLTCTATNWPILANRGKILWADIDPDTGNICPKSVENLANKYGIGNIGAVIVVHWGGYPCDLDELGATAVSLKVPVIEDAAHAFGSTYKGVPIGNHSDFTAFSFQAIKHLTTVDGGLLTLSNRSDYEKAKLLRWYGIDRENTCSRKDLRCEEDVKEYGFKFHMNDVNAVIGMANLLHIHRILLAHRSNAGWYKRELENVPGVKLLKETPDRNSSYWLFTLKVEERDNFIEYMKSHGVMTSKVHARNDKNSCVSNFKTELPNLDEFEKQMVCLPVGYHVSLEDREYITDLIKKGW